MHAGKYAVCGILAAALICGALFVLRDAADAVPFSLDAERNGKKGAGGFFPLRELLPPDDLLALGDGEYEERLAFARRHPERPWLLWHCLLRTKPFRVFPRIGDRAAFAEEPLEVRELAAAFEKSAEELCARDPENGLPLLCLAYLEFRRGCSLRDDPGTGGKTADIVDPERVEAGVALFRRAGAKGRVTSYGRERCREWIAMLGPRDSMLRSMEATLLLFGSPAIEHAMTRDLALYVSAAAEKRLRRGDEDGAVALLREMRIVGLRLLAEANEYFTAIQGYYLAGAAADAGARMLLDADRPEAAERLLEAGQAAYRPFFLERLLRASGRPEDVEKPFPLLAARLLPTADPERFAPPPRGVNATLENGGYGLWLSYAMGAPGFRVDSDEVFTPEELAASGRLEYWGIARTAWTALICLYAVVIGLGCVILIVVLLQSRFGSDRDAEDLETPWPDAKHVAADSVGAGLLSLLPGLLAAHYGYSPAAAGWSALGRLAFWTGWGVLCAMWYVEWRAYSLHAAEVGQRRWIRFGIFALFIAVPCAAYAFGDALHVYPAYASFIALLLSFLALSAHKPNARKGIVRYMTTLAGCLLFWIAAWHGISRQEKEWAHRAVLTAHRAEDPVCAAIPAEGRILLLHSQHALRHLAKDGNSLPAFGQAISE